MLELILLSIAAASGYAAAVFSWPTARQWFVGIETEIALLRDRARVLEARLRAQL